MPLPMNEDNAAGSGMGGVRLVSRRICGMNGQSVFFEGCMALVLPGPRLFLRIIFP